MDVAVYSVLSMDDIIVVVADELGVGDDDHGAARSIDGRESSCICISPLDTRGG